MNTFVIGCRWSEHGDSRTSIIDIFKKYDLVFAGQKQVGISRVEKNDLIAIKDGKTVVAIAKVLGKPKSITEQGINFNNDEKNRFDYEDYVLGIKVEIIEIPIDSGERFLFNTDFHNALNRH